MRAPWWSTTRGDLTIAASYAVLLLVCAAAGVGSFAWAGTWAQSWAAGLGGAGAVAWFGALAALPGVLGVATRHRWPRVAIAAIGCSALAAGALGSSVACLVMLFELLFTLYLLGGTRGPALSRGLAVGLGAALILATAVGGGGVAGVLNAALIAAVALGLPVLWAADLRKADDLRSLEARRAQQEAASAAGRAELAVARERTRMAGELHDTISGHLSAIALQAQAAQISTDPALSARALAQIREGSVAALEQMRSLIDVLHAGGAQPETTGGVSDFGALAQRAEAAGHEVALEVAAGSVLADDAAQAAAFRVASEGVTNALKHAPRSRVRLLARPGPGHLEVRVENGPPAGVDGEGGRAQQPGEDAPAAPTPAGNRLGLAQLRARVKGLGGTLEAGPTHSGGWSLCAYIPTGDAQEPRPGQAVLPTSKRTEGGAT